MQLVSSATWLSLFQARLGGRASSTGRAVGNPRYTWAAKRTAETAAEPTWVINYNEDGDDLARENVKNSFTLESRLLSFRIIFFVPVKAFSHEDHCIFIRTKSLVQRIFRTYRLSRNLISWHALLTV